jgi:glycosyltransferase involved in cell wall biosynthesis
MAPARILFYYGSQQFDTGSPKALVEQIELLDRARFTPLFLARGEGPLLPELEKRGVEIVRGPVATVSLRRPLAAVAAVRSQMRALRRIGVDLLHVNEMGWNLDLVLAAWALRIPVVLQLHLPGSVELQNLHRFAASKVLLVSAAQRAVIDHVDRFGDRLSVLYSPVDISRYGAGRNIRPSLGVADDDIVVTTVAQLREGKGIDIVLDAARRLAPEFPRLRFLLVGPLGRGEEEFGRGMMAQAEQPPLAGVVRFLGSRADVPDVLASSDIFLLPTRAETFGRAAAEAMAAGLPPVVSRIPPMEEIITTPDLGVLVSPRTGEAFAGALRAVLLQADRGRAMGIRGRNSLVGRFDRETIAKRLNSLYAELTDL